MHLGTHPVVFAGGAALPWPLHEVGGGWRRLGPLPFPSSLHAQTRTGRKSRAPSRRRSHQLYWPYGQSNTKVVPYAVCHPACCAPLPRWTHTPRTAWRLAVTWPRPTPECLVSVPIVTTVINVRCHMYHTAALVHAATQPCPGPSCTHMKWV